MDRAKVNTSKNKWDAYRKNISITEIEETIHYIEETIKTPNHLPPTDEVDKLLKFLVMTDVPIKEKSKFFRVRQNEKSEKIKVQGVWFPENKENCKRGRFNCDECCKAYFADSPETARNETFYKSSDHYHILESYIINTDITAGYIPIIDAKLEQITSNKLNDFSVNNFNYILDSFNEECRAKIIKVVTFFGDKITKKTTDYRFTNMLGIMLFHSFKLDVFVYPSVKSNLATNNLVFKPDVANNCIQPIQSMKLFNNHPGLADLTMFDKAKKPIHIGFPEK